MTSVSAVRFFSLLSLERVKHSKRTREGAQTEIKRTDLGKSRQQKLKTWKQQLSARHQQLSKKKKSHISWIIVISTHQNRFNNSQLGAVLRTPPPHTQTSKYCLTIRWNKHRLLKKCEAKNKSQQLTSTAALSFT